MADGEVEVAIKIKPEVQGAKVVQNELEKTGNAAKRAAKNTKDAAKGASSAIGDLSKTVGFLKKALTGFGVAGLFTVVVGSINKVRESFDAAAKAAEDLKKVQEELGASKAIQGLATQYDRLKESIASAKTEAEHQLDMIDRRVQSRRRREEAEADAAKEEELAALNPEDADYNEKKQIIEAKYAREAAQRAASNEREDAILARQKLQSQADMQEQAATAQEAQSAVIQERIAKAKREKSVAEAESVDLNDADKTGFWDATGKTAQQLFTLDWGRVAQAKTAEGDQKRLDAAKRAAELELEIERLQEEKRKSDATAQEMRKEAGRIRERRDVMAEDIETIDIKAETSRGVANRNVEAGVTALTKKRDENTDAMTASENLQREKASLETRLAEERARKAAAAKNVYDAGNALDLAKANGSGVAAATSNLHSAQTAANEVNASADKAINALTETLKDVKKRLEAATDHMRKQSSQTHYAWSESPPGA